MTPETHRSEPRRTSDEPATVVTLDRTPPHSLEAERAVLGAIIWKNAGFETAAELVTVDDFYRHAHCRIFRHMQVLAERHEPIDLLTLRESLAASDELDKVGGPAYIAQLVDGVPNALNVAYYAGIVREKAIRRRVMAAATRALSAACDPSDDIAQVLDRAQQDLLDVAAHRTATGLIPVSDLMAAFLTQLEHAHAHQGMLTGVSTGLADLDRLTLGWQPGHLIVIASRPGVGKSTLALCVAERAAALCGRPVAFFSLEMSAQELTRRLVSAKTAIDGHRIAAGRVAAHEQARIAQTAAALSPLPLYVESNTRVSVQQIRSATRRLQMRAGGKLGLVVVDYLQLAQGSGRSENRNLEVGEISRGLKCLAMDLQVPVLALSQLNRAVEARGNKRPQLSDLRESGNLEQDADLVIFIHREEMVDERSADRGTAELIVRKHRGGPIGTIRVGFDAATTQFRNFTPEAGA